MIGWFVAAESGECDGCGHKTKVGASIYYSGSDDGNGVQVDQRLCVECAP